MSSAFPLPRRPFCRLRLAPCSSHREQPALLNPSFTAMHLCCRPILLLAACLLLAGCETTQGPSPGLNQQPAAPLGERIEQAPTSRSFSGQKDVFQGAEYDPGVASVMPGAKQLRLRIGQVTEVFQGSFAPGDGQYELAFYLPVEARTVVQLVVETRGFTKVYFLRAIGAGETVGGVVERRWLDRSGYNPDNAADEARIQNAVRAAPYLISVHR
jgi:hypothetical protein